MRIPFSIAFAPIALNNCSRYTYCNHKKIATNLRKGGWRIKLRRNIMVLDNEKIDTEYGYIPKQDFSELMDKVPDWLGNDEDRAHKEKLTNIWVRKIHETPDLAGVCYYFIEGFITPEMENDFPMIEWDFMQHCRSKLREFDAVGKYGNFHVTRKLPKHAIHRTVLRLMLNGALDGDNYCIALMKNLYKTYYRKEYNQIKRFKIFSPQDVSFMCEGENEEFCINVARIFGMFRIMGIPLTEYRIGYGFLEANRILDVEATEKQIDGFTVEEQVFIDSMAQVDEWMREPEGESSLQIKRILKPLIKADEFTVDCFEYYGLSDNIIKACSTRGSVNEKLAQTLSLMRTASPNKSYTFEQVQIYTIIYCMATAIADFATGSGYEANLLLGVIDPNENPPDGIKAIKFDPKKINYREAETKKPDEQPAAKLIITEAEAEGNAAEDYLAEIEGLRRKLRESEQSNQALRHDIRQLRKAKDEKDALVSKYEAERDELIALREFAYKLEQNQETEPDTSYDDMIKAIANKKIVIIGGHINWINKLKKMFPNWKYILPDTGWNIDGRALANNDRVMFFTDHISHITYNKFIAAVREWHIPFGYLPTINMEQVVRQIYEETREAKQ